MTHFFAYPAKMKCRQLTALFLALAVQVVFWGILSRTTMKGLSDQHALSPMLMELRWPVAGVGKKPCSESSSALTQAFSSARKGKRADNSPVIHAPGLNGLPDSALQRTAEAQRVIAESQGGAVLDVETLKAQARSLTRESDAGKHTASAVQSEASLSGERVQETLTKAARPNCAKDYTPAIGAIKFDGLFKAPFLIAGAISGKGCKW